jgi:surfactin synthase thioesterase subunit
MFLPAVKNDYRAVETYRDIPGRSVNCPITALIGDSDPRVTTDEARAWADHTTGPFDLRIFPGGHFYLVDQARPVLQLIADGLTSG